jgi:hypothetical protein
LAFYGCLLWYQPQMCLSWQLLLPWQCCQSSIMHGRLRFGVEIKSVCVFPYRGWVSSKGSFAKSNNLSFLQELWYIFYAEGCSSLADCPVIHPSLEHCPWLRVILKFLIFWPLWIIPCAFHLTYDSLLESVYLCYIHLRLVSNLHFLLICTLKISLLLQNSTLVQGQSAKMSFYSRILYAKVFTCGVSQVSNAPVLFDDEEVCQNHGDTIGKWKKQWM